MPESVLTITLVNHSQCVSVGVFVGGSKVWKLKCIPRAVCVCLERNLKRLWSGPEHNQRITYHRHPAQPPWPAIRSVAHLREGASIAQNCKQNPSLRVFVRARLQQQKTHARHNFARHK